MNTGTQKTFFFCFIKAETELFCFQETESQQETEQRWLERLQLEDFGPSALGRLRKVGTM